MSSRINRTVHFHICFRGICIASSKVKLSVYVCTTDDFHIKPNGSIYPLWMHLQGIHFLKTPYRNALLSDSNKSMVQSANGTCDQYASFFTAFESIRCTHQSKGHLGCNNKFMNILLCIALLWFIPSKGAHTVKTAHYNPVALSRCEAKHLASTTSIEIHFIEVDL